MSEQMGLNKAETVPATRPGGQQCRFLTFHLGEEEFAMEIQCVKEVIQYCGLTTVPLMPGSIRGVINLRGAVVPVIDLSVRFGRPATAVSRRTCVVILELEQDEATTVLGVMVDQVREVLEIAPDEMEPPPAFGSRLPRHFVRGVGRVAGKFVLVLDADQALSVQDLAG